MDLVVPEMGNCTELSLDFEIPSTATQFRKLKRDAGIALDSDYVTLIDLFPSQLSMIKVDLGLKRRRKSTLRVRVQLQRIQAMPDKPLGEGINEVDPDKFWTALTSLATDPVLADAFTSFHYERGTFQLKSVDLPVFDADKPKDEPSILIDGISMRFANFSHGLQQVRIYAMGESHRRKCLQLDVWHRYETGLSGDVFKTLLSLGKTAAGMFVESAEVAN